MLVQTELVAKRNYHYATLADNLDDEALRNVWTNGSLIFHVPSLSTRHNESAICL